MIRENKESDLYQDLYSYKYGGEETTIYSKKKAFESGVVKNSNGRTLRYAVFDENSMNLLFISTHNMNGMSAESISARCIQYKELFDWISGMIALKGYSSNNDIKAPYHDYCIIGMDSNSATDVEKNS